MWLVKAPRTRACCTDCGRMAALFKKPCTAEEGLREALRRRLGTEAALRARIADMLASGQLREVQGGKPL